jgi:hypothetical protein
MVHLRSDGPPSEYDDLRVRFRKLEREEIVRQREAIIWLEHRVEALMRMRSPVRRAFLFLADNEVDEAYRVLQEVLDGWPST